MRRVLIGVAASLLTLSGLAVSPTVARADHHDWNHHGHHGWDRDHWRGSYAPYRSYYYVPNSYPLYVPSYNYAAPYYDYGVYDYGVPYYGYSYPTYGFGYQGPRVSFWIGR